MTWKTHRDAVFYGDARKIRAGLVVLFGRIGAGSGQDKRKIGLPAEWTFLERAGGPVGGHAVYVVRHAHNVLCLY